MQFVVRRPRLIGNFENAGGIIAPPPVVLATFDPANKSPNISLSNGNLTETKTINVVIADLVRSTIGHSTGKFYCEFLSLHEEFAQDVGIGVVNSNQAFTSSGADQAGLIGGLGFNSVAIYSDGKIYINDVSVLATGLTWANGDGSIFGMAWDLTNGQIWFRKNGGNWNGSPTANPATNTGGQSLSTLNAAPPYYAGAGAITDTTGTPDTVTANFGASAYANPAPAGFGNS